MRRLLISIDWQSPSHFSWCDIRAVLFSVLLRVDEVYPHIFIYYQDLPGTYCFNLKVPRWAFPNSYLAYVDVS